MEALQLTEQQFGEAERIFEESNANASIPLSIIGGEPLRLFGSAFIQNTYSGADEGDLIKISAAADASYAMSRGYEEIYANWRTIAQLGGIRENVPPTIPFQFVNLRGLPRYDHAIPLLKDKNAIGDTLTRLLDIAKNKAEGPLYTPLFANRNDPHSQMEARLHVQTLISKLTGDIQTIQDGGEPLVLKIHNQERALVIDSITRAKLLPVALPVNSTPGDFDSGNCDVMLNTSFAPGEHVHILASYGNHMFVRMFGREGWVPRSHLSRQTERDAKLFARQYESVFYVGSDPLFYASAAPGRQKALLPADVIYHKDGSFFVMDSLPKINTVVIHQLPAIPDTSVTRGLTTPQEALNFLFQLKLPYLWGVFDCSEVMRRMFALLGHSVRKYSGDMVEDLAVLEEPTHIDTRDGLTRLADGMYIGNLSTPVAKDGQTNYRSIHMFLMTKMGKQLDAFSYAFEMLSAQGEREFPVGADVRDIDDLAAQFQRNRRISVQQIAR